jgi:WD40 repeat protein/serine/threonine protein kinase
MQPSSEEPAPESESEPATLPPSPSIGEAELLPSPTRSLLSAPSPTDTLKADPTAGPLPTVPGYEILSELGRGGMGVVYKARHIRLNRLVALKMILAGGHAGAAELTRFRTEAEAIARLHHANIVQIHEISEHDRKPYLSLEFCGGGSLAQRLNGMPWPTKDAARLVETLARAIDLAHQQGIIHRDLKPANILLQGSGVRSQGSGVSRAADSCLPTPDPWIPKITDFGLAKKLDEAGQAASGAIMGTPSYMAPEQAGGKTKEVGPATDIYALGAILYELLTGRPPFRAATYLDTILQVVSDLPVPPTQLQSTTPKDLETICLKCLAKERVRRYGSAMDLSQDLTRWLSGEPIQARPVGRLERLRLWCRRNPTVAIAGSTAIVALVLGTIVSLLFGIQASNTAAELFVKKKETQDALDDSEKVRKELQKTDEKRRRFTRQSALLALEKAVKFWDQGDATLAALWFTRSLQMVEKQDADLDEVIRCNLSYVPLYIHPLKAILPHDQPVWHIAFSPDDQRVLTAGDDETARLWESPSGNPIGRPMQNMGKVHAAVFSPDGKQIATASESEIGTARLWDGLTGRSLNKIFRHVSPVTALTFSPDNKRVVTGDKNGALRTWDIASGGVLANRSLNPFDQPRGSEPFAFVKRIVFDREGRFAVALCQRSTGLWDDRSAGPLQWFDENPKVFGDVNFLTLALDPKGKLLATGCHRGKNYVRLWDVRTARPIEEARFHPERIWGLAFSPDGKSLASACSDGRVRLWDVSGGKLVEYPPGRAMMHHADVECVAFSPDSKRLLSGGRDNAARLWNVADQTPLGGPLYQGLVAQVAFNKSGTLAGTASLDNAARLWGLAPGRVPSKIFAKSFAMASLASGSDAQLPHFSEDGRAILAADDSGLLDNGSITAFVLSPGGNLLLTGHRRLPPDPRKSMQPAWPEDAAAILWDVNSGKRLGQLTLAGKAVTAVAFCPDGKTALALAESSDLIRWDLATGKVLGGPWKLPGVFQQMEISPDGENVLVLGPPQPPTGAQEGLIWNLSSARIVKSRQFPPGRTPRFSPDGRIMAVKEFFTMSLFRLPKFDQQSLLTFPAGVVAFAFTPDSKRLVTASMDGRCRFWDPATGKHVSEFTLPTGYASMMAVSPDSKALLTCTSGTGVARLWDTATGLPLGPELPLENPGTHVAFNRQGTHFFTRCDLFGRGGSTTVYQRPMPLSGDVERLTLWVQVLTGVELDSEGRTQVLSFAEWNRRRERLQKEGPPATTLGEITTTARPLIPVTLRARKSAPKDIKLDEISRAMFVYLYNRKTWPPAAICDQAGKPLLSWRVAILPYFDPNLYGKFNLHEPWDSAHNRKLIPLIPYIYSPRAGASKPGETHYRVFVGGGAGFEWNKGMRFPQDFKDGTSNTIMIVEAAESVPWTKPDELSYDPKKPLAKFVEPNFQALLFDGSVREFRSKTPEPALRAWITRSGGETIPADE